jgi:hypothetical protein
MHKAQNVTHKEIYKKLGANFRPFAEAEER